MLRSTQHKHGKLHAVHAGSECCRGFTACSLQSSRFTDPASSPALLVCPFFRSKGDGDYEVCDDFIIDDWLRQKINASQEELVKEKECVGHLIGIQGAACRIGPGEDTMLPGEN